MFPQATADYSANYWLPNLKAWLRCGSECGLELAVSNPGGESYHRADVEILLQPRGSDGLPLGGPMRLAVLRVLLHRFPGGRTWWGRAMLPPGLNADVAARCHFRVRMFPPDPGPALATEKPCLPIDQQK